MQDSSPDTCVPDEAGIQGSIHLSEQLIPAAIARRRFGLGLDELLPDPDVSYSIGSVVVEPGSDPRQPARAKRTGVRRT